MDHQPRSLLITGASSGIGEALAHHYATPGAHLALTGRDAARLDSVAAACRARGAKAEIATIDVTDSNGLRRWIERIDDATPLDLVIANAGVSTSIGAQGEDETAARRVLATNIEGVFNTVFPLIPRMQARRVGQIALVSSLAAFRGLPITPSYSASKAAVKALGESWRVLLQPDGIRVSVICPGFITTRMTAKNDFPMPFLMSADRAAAIIARGLARDKGRIAFPWPIATVCWMLAALPWRLSDRLVRPLAGGNRAGSAAGRSRG
jgi:short-subunit dehydrogenase